MAGAKICLRRLSERDRVPYLVELVRATREHRCVKRAEAPDATIALVRMARAAAWLEGRGFVTPDDIAAQFPLYYPSPAAFE